LHTFFTQRLNRRETILNIFPVTVNEKSLKSFSFAPEVEKKVFDIA